jgi:uncharacterized cupin superfamily protein
MKIVRTTQMEWQQMFDRPKYGARRKALGGEKLTCGMWELAPGKKSFPLHVHYVTEEAMFVISGNARLRTSEGEHMLGPGDHVSFPAGGPAHQIINDGPEPFTFIGMSAVFGADIVEYPDSGKLACAIGSAPGGKRFIFRKSQQAEYFEGEE